MDVALQRTDFLRPITVAIAFTLVGEVIYFLLWGVMWFPEGDLWRKAGWTATCGIAMGATVGALVVLFVMGKPESGRAVIWTAAIYAGVLLYCTALCYLIALSVGYFGAASQPTLFIAGSVIPVLLSAGVYAWLVASVRGERLLSKVGM